MTFSGGAPKPQPPPRVYFESAGATHEGEERPHEHPAHQKAR